MSSELYKVIITGEVLPGVDKDRAIANLAALFKIEYTKADHFFSSKPVIVKKNLSLAKAENYKAAIEKAGAVCLLESIIVSLEGPDEGEKQELHSLHQTKDENPIYIGFWARFVASILDNILLTLIIVPPLLYFFAQGRSPVGLLMGGGDGGDSFMVLGSALIEILVWVSISTTPGKMLFRGVIVDARTGGKPSAMQFTIRYLGYYVSMIPLFLGFIWVAFDNRKQGWHDKIANTVVVQKTGIKSISKKTLLLFVFIFILSLMMLGFVGVRMGKNWWEQNSEMLKNKAMAVKGEGDDFGKATDNQGCLEEAIQRDLNCDGFKCSLKINFFLSFCLQASDPTPGFCDGVPSKDAFMETIAWRLRRCLEIDHSESSCNELFGTVQEYCFSDNKGVAVKSDMDIMDEIEGILSEKK